MKTVKHWNDDNNKTLLSLYLLVSKINSKHSEEVEQCLVPKCVTKKWKTLKTAKMKYEESVVNFIIDSSTVIFFQIS